MPAGPPGAQAGARGSARADPSGDGRSSDVSASGPLAGPWFGRNAWRRSGGCACSPAFGIGESLLERGRCRSASWRAGGRAPLGGVGMPRPGGVQVGSGARASGAGPQPGCGRRNRGLRIGSAGRGRGGTGRHTSLRSRWAKALGGSSPSARMLVMCRDTPVRHVPTHHSVWWSTHLRPHACCVRRHPLSDVPTDNSGSWQPHTSARMQVCRRRPGRDLYKPGRSKGGAHALSTGSGPGAGSVGRIDRLPRDRPAPMRGTRLAGDRRAERPRPRRFTRLEDDSALKSLLAPADTSSIKHIAATAEKEIERGGRTSRRSNGHRQQLGFGPIA